MHSKRQNSSKCCIHCDTPYPQTTILKHRTESITKLKTHSQYKYSKPKKCKVHALQCFPPWHHNGSINNCMTLDNDILKVSWYTKVSLGPQSHTDHWQAKVLSCWLNNAGLQQSSDKGTAKQYGATRIHERNKAPQLWSTVLESAVVMCINRHAFTSSCYKSVHNSLHSINLARVTCSVA